MVFFLPVAVHIDKIELKKIFWNRGNREYSIEVCSCLDSNFSWFLKHTQVVCRNTYFFRPIYRWPPDWFAISSHSNYVTKKYVFYPELQIVHAIYIFFFFCKSCNVLLQHLDRQRSKTLPGPDSTVRPLWPGISQALWQAALCWAVCEREKESKMERARLNRTAGRIAPSYSHAVLRCMRTQSGGNMS